MKEKINSSAKILLPPIIAISIASLAMNHRFAAAAILVTVIVSLVQIFY